MFCTATASGFATGSPAGAKPRSVAHQARTAPPRENHAENLTKTSRIPPPEPPRKPPRKPARKPPRKPPENQPEYLSNTWLLFVLLNGAVPWGWGPKLVFGRFSGGFRVGFRLGFRAPSGRRPPEAVRRGPRLRCGGGGWPRQQLSAARRPQHPQASARPARVNDLPRFSLCRLFLHGVTHALILDPRKFQIWG